MPSYILRLKDKQEKFYYIEWSTVVDAPVSEPMTREQFERHYKNKYGTNGMYEFPERMKRVDEKGVSSHMDVNDRDCVLCNRAGPHETCISYDEIVSFYCLKEPANENHPCWKKRREEWNKIHEDQGGMSLEEINAYHERWKDAHLKPETV